MTQSGVAELAAFLEKGITQAASHISGEIFKPAQGSHFDLNVLAM
jgi:hypothetical protein